MDATPTPLENEGEMILTSCCCYIHVHRTRCFNRRYSDRSTRIRCFDVRIKSLAYPISAWALSCYPYSDSQQIFHFVTVTLSHLLLPSPSSPGDATGLTPLVRGVAFGVNGKSASVSDYKNPVISRE